MWTESEVRQLYEAVRDKKIEKVKALMDIYQSRLEPINPLKNAHHFYIACTLGLDTVVDFYLSIPGIVDKITLYNGLEQAVQANETEVVELLLNKHKLDPNYIIPPHETFEYIVYGVERISMSLLAIACLRQKKDMVRCLLSHKNVNVNLQWDSKDVIGLTTLYYIAQQKDRWNLEITQLLLDAGADPRLTTIIKHTDKTVTPPVEQEYKLNALDAAIYFQNTQAVDLLNKWIKNGNRIQKRDFSPEPSSKDSSGSNSPASAGSPQSSPPRHSAILQKTPPDSPVASRSVTPLGSPMPTSDNSSGGSTGSSPEKVYANPAAPYQFTIPSGNSDLVHEFHEALKKNRFQDAKAIYDTGRVKPDCYCAPCKVNAVHYMMNNHNFKGMEEIEDYVLHHPKYPANINGLNVKGKTFLHFYMSGERISVKWLTWFYQKYADKSPDLNIRDNEGNAPLHYAAVGGASDSPEVVQELLNRGANPTITNNQGLTARELCAKSCPKDDIKKKVLAVFDDQLNPYQKQKPSVQAPVAATVRETTNSAAPIIYTGGNKATMFPSQNSGTNGNSLNFVPLTTPPAAAQRSDAKSVGALYAPPPQASVELPKHVAKEEPAAAPRADTKKSLGDRVKGLFHIK